MQITIDKREFLNSIGFRGVGFISTLSSPYYRDIVSRDYKIFYRRDITSVEFDSIISLKTLWTTLNYECDTISITLSDEEFELLSNINFKE